MQCEKYTKHAERRSFWIRSEVLRKCSDREDGKRAAQPEGNHRCMPRRNAFSNSDRSDDVDELKHIVRFAS
jgi:hypothetical protein